jgi:hypothetical protein
MSLAISSNPAANPAALQAQNPAVPSKSASAAPPKDTVQISKAGLAAAGGDVDHDGDSH